jgi:hypothetical protein
MPRNRYTRAIRIDRRAQIAPLKDEITEITNEVDRKGADVSSTPFVNRSKERRLIRREQKMRHKPTRFRGNSQH